MKALFKTSHNNKDIKGNPIFSIEALEAMKNIKPDKNGLKKSFKELGKIDFEYQKFKK